MYSVLWAVEHAPVKDAEERAILVALVSKGDFDGCNCYRSYPTLARVARVDARTALRRCQAMEKRGIIRRQPGPRPTSWLRLPKDKRPVVWEVMIPSSFWSPVQLEEINAQRAERGRAPITPGVRPDLGDAPHKAPRADKGVERPRKRKGRGDYKTPRNEGGGVTTRHSAGGLQDTPRGDYKTPNPPIEPSDVPSSPPKPSPDGAARGPGGEDENSDAGQAPAPDGTCAARDALKRAEALIDDAVRRWPQRHRAPGPRDRQRLCERVAAELEAGGDDGLILVELTRDMREAADAVKVVMGSRTRTPGWGRCSDPRPKPLRHAPDAPRPVWCGMCDETTRLVAAVAADGSQRMHRCARCHPDPDTAPAEPDGDGEETGGELDEAVMEQMRSSLQGSASPQEPRQGGVPESAGSLVAGALEEMERASGRWADRSARWNRRE